jgi:hypothetical protein
MEIPEFLVTLIGGGFVGYFVKYFLDRRMQIVAEIMAQKREVYAHAASSMRIFLSGAGNGSPQQERFLADYATLWLWGSDEVIRSLNSFLDLVRVGEEPPISQHQKTLRGTYGATMLLMRKDLRNTDLSEKDFRFVVF